MGKERSADEAIVNLKRSFHIRTNNRELILLHAIKNLLPAADDESKRQQGMVILGFASQHKLTDKQLLQFFGTTLDAARESVGTEFLREHGLFRSLVTSPFLSTTCEIFFDGWLAAAYDENPFKCQLRRVGRDAFRVVSVLTDGKEVEYPEDMTAVQVLESTNCPKDELQEMPVLQ